MGQGKEWGPLRFENGSSCASVALTTDAFFNMPERRAIQEEIDRLKERLKKNEQLLKEAGIKAEEMQALETSLDHIKEAIERTRSEGGK